MLCPLKIILYYIHFIVCVHVYVVLVHTCHSSHVKVRGQLGEVRFLLPLCRSQESNSGDYVFT